MFWTLFTNWKWSNRNVLQTGARTQGKRAATKDRTLEDLQTTTPAKKRKETKQQATAAAVEPQETGPESSDQASGSVTQTPPQNEPELEVIEIEDSNDAMAVDIALDLDADQHPLERSLLHVGELPTTFDSARGNSWEQQSIQGTFVDCYKEKDVQGTLETNKNETWTIRVIKLADIKDPTRKVRVTIWGRAAIDHFLRTKPKFKQNLILHNLTIKRMPEAFARANGTVLYQANCNATHSADFEKSENQPTIEYIRLDGLGQMNHGTVVNFIATIAEVENKREDWKVVRVRQQNGGWHLIHFWKNGEKFQENLDSLKKGMHCAFQGIKMKNDGKLFFSKILQIKFKNWTNCIN